MGLQEDKTEHQKRIESFMVRADQTVPVEPTIPSDNVRLLRAKLVLEEALELMDALAVTVDLRFLGTGAGGSIPADYKNLLFKVHPTKLPDLISIADACADISVVNIGTLSACGISDRPVLIEVDRSNLDKFRGDGHKADNGKWMKPSDWIAPNLEAVLDRQRLSNGD